MSYCTLLVRYNLEFGPVKVWIPFQSDIIDKLEKVKMCFTYICFFYKMGFIDISILNIANLIGLVSLFVSYSSEVFWSVQLHCTLSKLINATIDGHEFSTQIGFRVTVYYRNKSSFHVPHNSRSYVHKNKKCHLSKLGNELVHFNFNFDPITKLKW